MSSVNLNDLSIEALKKLVKEKNEVVKKLEEEKEKEKLLLAYKKLQKKEVKKDKLRFKSDFFPKYLKRYKSKSKSKQKEKRYMEYFQECIKNKTIPKDTPYYFKKALERAMKEYEKGIKLEKSALFSFAEMYVIDGKPGVTPMQYFLEIVYRLKDFLRNHRNIKLRAILVCLMEKNCYKIR